MGGDGHSGEDNGGRDGDKSDGDGDNGHNGPRWYAYGDCVS